MGCEASGTRRVADVVRPQVFLEGVEVFADRLLSVVVETIDQACRPPTGHRCFVRQQFLMRSPLLVLRPLTVVADSPIATGRAGDNAPDTVNSGIASWGAKGCARTSIFGRSFRTTILAGCCSFAGVAALAAPARASGFPLTDPACEAGYAPVIACEEIEGTAADRHQLPCDAVAGNDCAARQTLLGDVGGLRPGLVASGITADLDLT